MAVTPDGGGYWLVAADGGVFTFGDAGFFGSAGATSLPNPIVGIASSPDGQGYWLTSSDGGVLQYGDAQYLGGASSLGSTSVVGIAVPPVFHTVPPPIQVSYQSNSGYVYDYGAGYTGNTGYQMMAGTSPSTTVTTAGCCEVAYVDTSGNLGVAGPNGTNPNLGLGVESGTSPSITALSSGGYEVAFAAAGTDDVYDYGATYTGPTGLGTLAGTSPSTAATAAGCCQVAYVGTSGNLAVGGPDGYVANTYLGVDSGTSPSIVSLPSGDYEVAFAASGGNHDVYDYGTFWIGDSDVPELAGTSPSLTDTTSGCCEDALVDQSANLETAGPVGTEVTGLGVAPGTNTSIVELYAGGYEAAFLGAGTNYLWLYGSFPAPYTAINTGLPPGMADTNPSITERLFP
jgi:hypothetical protein